MRYKHFYGPNATSLRHTEDEALRLWSSTFRRGLSAMKYKRYQAAEIYLGAAYEIGVLRLDSTDNKIFDAGHVIEPAKWLVEFFLTQNNVAGAHSFFNETQYLLRSKAANLSAAQERALHEIQQTLQLFQRDRHAGFEAAIGGLSAPVSTDALRPRRQPRRQIALAAQSANT